MERVDPPSGSQSELPIASGRGGRHPPLPAVRQSGPIDVAGVEIIYPNFKRRLSGVTTSMLRLVPTFQARGVGIATLGPGVGADGPHLRFGDLFALWRRPHHRNHRIWHARRNVEMAGGIVLRSVFRMPLKLVFTSAAQRRHKPLTRWFIRRMDAIVATSANSEAFLKVPATIVPHGIDAERLRPAEDKRAQKAALGFDPNKRYLGCFGRVRHQKGTDVFIDAILPILQQQAEWDAIVSGRVTAEHSAFANDLRDRVAAAGLTDRVHFVGEHPDIDGLFRAIDLFVAPARWEGFGLTPLEAMACGVPVVTSDAGAFPQIVRDGVTGVVVREASAKAFEDAIRRFVENDEARRVAGAAARRHVTERHALDREAASLLAIYDRLSPPLA